MSTRYLSDFSNVVGIRDVILSYIAMQPVADVQIMVVQGNENVGDQAFKKFMEIFIRIFHYEIVITQIHYLGS